MDYNNHNFVYDDENIVYSKNNTNNKKSISYSSQNDKTVASSFVKNCCACAKPEFVSGERGASFYRMLRKRMLIPGC